MSRRKACCKVIISPGYAGAMSGLLAVAFGLYVLNLIVGVAAQLRLAHFGVWHHLLYFVVFATAVAALILAREGWLILTAGCLALMPRARPRTWLHPTLASIGLAGYVLALRGN